MDIVRYYVLRSLTTNTDVAEVWLSRRSLAIELLEISLLQRIVHGRKRIGGANRIVADRTLFTCDRGRGEVMIAWRCAK